MPMAVAGACDVLPPPPVIFTMIASTICGSAHDGSGTMSMSCSAAATTCVAGMSLGAPISSVRMRATLSRKDDMSGRDDRARPRGDASCPRTCVR
jgi:hypothetical protein